MNKRPLSAAHIDGVLVTWGDRLFYPGNRVVKPRPSPGLTSTAIRVRASAIRARIEATVVRRVPQVMVKVTGGGRGMKAIAAHFRYITKNGRLEIEDQRGEAMRGKDSLRDLVDEWRYSGSLIPDEPGFGRREAYNIMLSMPRGTDPLLLQRAAREFAQVELPDHKYVMVLHDHQANPHIHISVRAESKRGSRLNPRKADLHRWRETFAEKLRGYGIEAAASRQATRGRSRNCEPLWRVKAREDGRLRADGRVREKSGAKVRAASAEAVDAWRQLGRALASSAQAADRGLSQAIDRFVLDMPAVNHRSVQARSSDVRTATRQPGRRITR